MLSQLTFFAADPSNQGFVFPQVPTAPRASSSPLRFDWNVANEIRGSQSQPTLNINRSCFFINSFKNLKM